MRTIVAQRLERLAHGLGHLNGTFCLGARNVGAVLIACMTAIILAQVFFRYVLNNSLTWSEELSKAMMVWTAFLVAPWAYRMGSNVSLTMFIGGLPRELRTILRFALNLLVMWIIWVFLFEAISLWERGARIRHRPSICQ